MQETRHAAEVFSAATEGAVEARSTRGIRPLVWIMVAGAAVRLAFWSWYDGTTLAIWDERDYNAIAVNLVERGEFALRPGRPTSIRPPLYPFAVAGTYRLFGVENFRAIRLIQAGISLLTIPLVFRLGSAVYGRRVGLWAAGLYAFYPSLLAYNNLVLTEVLFTALLVSTCLILVPAMRRGSPGLMALAGVTLGLSALTRSVMWLFPAILVPFLIISGRDGTRRRLLAAACLLATFVVAVLPWSARNTRLQGAFTVIDVMGGRNFMMGNYEHTPMNRAWNAVAIGGERSWDRVLAEAHPEYDDLTQGQKDKLALRAAIRYVLAHPWLSFKRDVVKFFNFWGLERELVAGVAGNDLGPLGPLAVVLLSVVIFGTYAAAMILAVLGAIASPPPDWRAHALLLLVVGYVCAMHALAFGHSRYHLPLMPLVLIYSARALTDARGIWARRRRPAFALAISCAAVLAAWWIYEVTVVDLQRFLEAVRPAA